MFWEEHGWREGETQGQDQLESSKRSGWSSAGRTDHLELTTAGTAMTPTHGDFVFAAAGNDAEETGAPDPRDTPHANPPAAVQTLDALALLSLLQLALGGGLADELAGTLGVGRSRADALFVDDVPHGSHDAAVGAWGGDDGLDVGDIDGGGAHASAGGFLAQAQRCVGCDLGAAEHGLQREADGQLETGAEEGEEVPQGGVEEGVDGEVGFEEERGGCRDEVGQAGVQDGDGHEVRRDGAVWGGELANRADEGAWAVGGRGEH